MHKLMQMNEKVTKILTAGLVAAMAFAPTFFEFSGCITAGGGCNG